MRLIIISPPGDFPDEPKVVRRILCRIPATFHLRKPGQTDGQLAGYLKRVPGAHHHRIMVHGHPHLLSRFGLRGVHFTERQREGNLQGIRQLKQERPGCRLSSSFHRIADIAPNEGLFDSIFLSPVFDSISKPGYHAAFDHADIQRFLSRTDHNVVALGGIDARRIETAASLGFKGVAVLGAVWGATDPEEAAFRLSTVCRGLESHPGPGLTVP